MNSIQNVTSFYFSLAPFIYASSYEHAIIILDGMQDTYISLIDDAAIYFRFVLEHRFIQKNSNNFQIISCEDNQNNDYNDWICHFLEKKLITPEVKAPTYLSSPLQTGGLIEYRWDHKVSWQPFKESSVFNTLKAYFMLRKVHKVIKKQGINGIINLVKSYKKENVIHPSLQEIQTLAHAVDAASLLYFQKTLCLAWATTYTLLALKKNWNINLAIGVQTNPFYAHAWSETADGQVINDDPIISKVLSVIFKEPYNKEN